MTTTHAAQPPRTRLRLWPGVAAAVLLLLIKLVLPAVAPQATPVGVLGGMAAAAIILIWWLFLSRAPWIERLGAVALTAVALAATRPMLHPSMAGAGMGVLFYIFAVQTVSVALVIWAVATRRASVAVRRASLVATVIAASGGLALVRTEGLTGEGASDLEWRWSPTAEERLLAHAERIEPAPATEPPADNAAPGPAAPPAEAAPVAERTAEAPTGAAPVEPAAPAAVDPAPARAEWPGFRGPSRDGVIRGVRLETNWSASPPVEVWRRPVGPGWSSFAVSGNLFYTQEQRGEHEVVSCYRLDTGAPVWVHRDAVRFYESNGGAGPRGTPAVSGGRVFSVGATGILNALDARRGTRLWSRDAAADAAKEIPDWGIASSPLVIDDSVFVAIAGRLASYDAASGELRWLGPPEGGGYSSPHLATIGGVAQILLLRGRRTTSFSPADGSVLWEHQWEPSASIVQPGLTPDGDVLVNHADAMGGQGMRRLAVARGPGGWTVQERWTSRGLKPYFNDYVVHGGHAYGFDGSILSAIDLASGERKWKGGRYGHGQMLLLAEQDLLLVLSEEGELALVSATPDRYAEIARFKAIEGKTWNHPVLVGNLLLVRNGEEMAAFRLPSAASPLTSAVTSGRLP